MEREQDMRKILIIEDRKSTGFDFTGYKFTILRWELLLQTYT